MLVDPRSEPLAVIGAGSAGLITAHTLIKDGFQHVQIFTQDDTVGGVWCSERVYPSLTLNKYELYLLFIAHQSSKCSR